MSIVDYKVNADYYLDLAKQAVDNNELPKALRYYRSALSLDNLTREEIKKIKKDYAKALALRGKFSFSNRLLYEVLVESHNDSEAYAILMFNFKSVDYDQAANYYSRKARPYLNKRRDDFRKYLADLNQDYLYYDDVEIPVSDLKDDEFDRLMNGEFPFLEMMDNKERKQTFTVIDHVEEFDHYMNKLYDAARHEEYSKAIDYANDAIKLNVSDDIKIAAIYAKSVALMMMGYTRESLELANQMIAKHNQDHSFLLLKAELLTEMKDDKALIEVLSFFKDRPKDETMPFERIITLYLKRELYQEALEFIEPRLPYFTDSYTLLSYYGIILFDMGRVKQAKSVLSDLNGIYGDLCDAKHLLNYINSGIDKPLTNIPQFGEIKELTSKYSNELCLFLEQNNQSAMSYLAMDVDGLMSKLEWVIDYQKIELAIGVIDKIFVLYNERTNSQNRKALRKAITCVFNMPAIIDGLNPDIKETIYELRLLSPGHFGYLDSDNLFRVSRNVFKEINTTKTIYVAMVHALAYCMAKDSKNYAKTLEACQKIATKSQKKSFAWKSRRNIYALIVYLSQDRTMMPEKVVQNIIYDKKVFQKYLDEYDSIED